MRSLRDKVRRITPVVLIVDDDPVSRELTAGVLQTRNYDVTFAHDGTSALAVLRRRRPDLILMDLVLPDTDGVAMTQKLKAVPHLADIPVLMMTGDARRETLQSSMNAGAADFVVKPFSSDSLIRKADRFLSAV
jgi:CheY-like chemotaxis protein